MKSKVEVLPKIGRPSKYKEEYCDDLIKIFGNGGHVAHFCAKNKIRRSTFYEWLQHNEDFAEAYEFAKDASLAFYETLLLKGGTGQIDKFNFNAIAMVMNNKFRDDYTRSSSGGSNTEINIGTLNSIDLKNPQLVEERIKLLQQQLSDDDE